MSVDNEKKRVDCPDREFVSCFFDNELPADTVEFRHIADCDICGKSLDAYARLSRGLQAEMSGSVPADLADRICRRMKRRNSPRRKVLNFPALWLRVAALFIFIVLAALAISNLLSEKSSEDTMLADAKVLPLDALPADSGSGLTPDDGSARIDTDHQSAPGINISSLSPVSTGNIKPYRFASQVDDAPEPPTLIPDKVRHVWISCKPAACCDEFAKLAKAEGIEVKRDEAAKDGTTGLRFRASRKQLVKLVRAWAGSGHDLVNPSAPQPEQHIFAGNGDEPVNYQAVFVVANR